MFSAGLYFSGWGVSTYKWTLMVIRSHVIRGLLWGKGSDGGGVSILLFPTPISLLPCAPHMTAPQ